MSFLVGVPVGLRFVIRVPADYALQVLPGTFAILSTDGAAASKRIEGGMPKNVLITGAGSGFGKGASLALAARGHTVIATTETDAQAVALRAEAPQLTVEKLDITTDDVNKVTDWNVDVLVNNAGAGQTGPMVDVPIDRVRRLFEVNVFGTLAITQKVVPQMVTRGSGRVIIVSSIAGVMSGPAFGPYSMTKHALEAMGKAMRAELAGQGVDVTLLNPGPYNTGFNDRMADSMWEWFGPNSVNAGATDLFQMMRGVVTTGQLDPVEVVDRIVELVEADTTTENNFVPPGIRDMLAARVDS
jgi:NAD(P)-dependent dehydrogenase (short-subunit alcohol dehydrogenase family)